MFILILLPIISRINVRSLLIFMVCEKKGVWLKKKILCGAAPNVCEYGTSNCCSEFSNFL